MNKAYNPVIEWRNTPSTDTPLNETNLNKMSSALGEIDDRVVTFDTTKANQSDLLNSLKDVTYNTQTGLFTFIFWNGSTKEANLNIEKIPVSFEMSAQGVITMITDDGTTYTADVGYLIKTYTFNSSDTIVPTVTTDPDGNKTIVFNIANGSITADKLQPNFLADCESEKNAAISAANTAISKASEADGFSKDSEAWARGKRNGQDVGPSDPAYNDNAKYWASVAHAAAGGGVVTFNGRTGAVNPQDNDYSISQIAASGSQYQVPMLDANGKFVMGTVGQNGNFVGYSESLGNVKNKVVTVSAAQNFQLKVGCMLMVQFEYTNTASGTVEDPVTINVNNTGDYPIYYNDGIKNTADAIGTAGRWYTYAFGGDYWIYVSHGIDNNTTYGNYNFGCGYATCSTASATLAKEANINSRFAYTNGGIVGIKFTYAVLANSTININEKGAVPILHNNAAIGDNVIKAGDTAIMMYASGYFYLIGKLETQQTCDFFTAPVSAGIGNTSATVSDNRITANSIIDYPYISSSSGTMIGIYKVVVSSGSAVIYFDVALTEAISIRLHVRNDI